MILAEFFSSRKPGAPLHLEPAVEGPPVALEEE
jgi:hypothetical protein